MREFQSKTSQTIGGTLPTGFEIHQVHKDPLRLLSAAPPRLQQLRPPFLHARGLLKTDRWESEVGYYRILRMIL